MRRTIATFLMTALLTTSAPLLMRDRGQDPGFQLIKIIRTIVRHLIPMGDNIVPPKP